MTPELESLYARLTALCDAEERGEVSVVFPDKTVMFSTELGEK